jgi:hypothetical protein
MQKVRGIEKSMTVGTGQNSYKGMSDADVKEKISEAMSDAGLCILTISVDPKTTTERWEATDYNGKPTIKQQIFTEVLTKYLLLHESGESIELAGYGHGIDAQDKGAGKATTYALKNTLLYTFLVASKKIDDAEAHHSDDVQVPQKQAPEVKNNTKATVDSTTRLIQARHAYREFLMDNKHVFPSKDTLSLADRPEWIIDDFEKNYRNLVQLKKEREDILHFEAHWKV